MRSYTPGASMQWIDPTGVTWQLDNPNLGWFLLDEVTGLGAAPITLTTDPFPRGGSRVRWVQPEARLITLGLHIFGPDHPTFLSRWRSLGHAFARTRRDGPGRLVITRPDNTQREILAYYQEGWNNSPDAHFIDDDVVITLYAEDPFWRDPVDIVVPRTNVPPASFLSPYPTVSTTAAIGTTTLFNPGEADAWPDWIITGPFSSVTTTNRTTGESWTLNPSAPGIAHGPVLTGEQVRLTTDVMTVVGPDGSSWTGALNWPTASLWGLAPGDNDVVLTLGDAGFGSSFALTFKPRYEMP